MTNYTKHFLGVLAVVGLFCVVPSSEQVQAGHPETTEPEPEATETDSAEPETEQTEFVQFNLVIELDRRGFRGQ